jgi:hypothetical protein
MGITLWDSAFQDTNSIGSYMTGFYTTEDLTCPSGQRWWRQYYQGGTGGCPGAVPVRETYVTFSAPPTT